MPVYKTSIQFYCDMHSEKKLGEYREYHILF